MLEKSDGAEPKSCLHHGLPHNGRDHEWLAVEIGARIYGDD